MQVWSPHNQQQMSPTDEATYIQPKPHSQAIPTMAVVEHLLRTIASMGTTYACFPFKVTPNHHLTVQLIFIHARLTAVTSGKLTASDRCWLAKNHPTGWEWNRDKTFTFTHTPGPIPIIHVGTYTWQFPTWFLRWGLAKSPWGRPWVYSDGR